MISDAIGEHYCLCELLLAGKEAYLANGLTQKGWDIAVLDTNKTIRVQVKCRDWMSEGQTTIKGTFISREFDYLVIVLLNFNNEKFTTYVIPYEKLKEKTENDRAKLIDDDGYVYYSARAKNAKNTGFDKQAISISTISKQETQDLFSRYRSVFDSVSA